ncbi:hypothetical protein PAAG_05560 [Paracoccidioides lutzii Pb01]|uniref:Uncharacterized protein n=1 Tax=Paracoccidioides lutzii (strain ATCC MYA-826 / Pb01) TaxID=502779 RepID=C1H467_PARBA|nr:hypothetical protein PAAG_05560 [Paracoccidioides lutzii Pb01]EEH34511.2 hypothetical protein PAAG_05560 [Paracoccidioides lutzii Pb01]
MLRTAVAVGAFSSLDENEELEDSEQKSSSNHFINSSSCESDETSASESIHEFTAASERTPSLQPQMPTFNAIDMITMSVADLLIFCQQMTHQNASNINNDISADDFKSQICEYQKNVQRAIDKILVDVKVISETDILIKNQYVCSDDISQNMLNTEK